MSLIKEDVTETLKQLLIEHVTHCNPRFQNLTEYGQKCANHADELARKYLHELDPRWTARSAKTKATLKVDVAYHRDTTFYDPISLAESSLNSPPRLIEYCDDPDCLDCPKRKRASSPGGLPTQRVSEICMREHDSRRKVCSVEGCECECHSASKEEQ